MNHWLKTKLCVVRYRSYGGQCSVVTGIRASHIHTPESLASNGKGSSAGQLVNHVESGKMEVRWVIMLIVRVSGIISKQKPS